MPKVGMEPVRRRQIIDATMACIHQEGIRRASMQRIARRAGVTAGLVVHYFDDKEGLLEAVYRDLYRRLGEQTITQLKQASNHSARLRGVLEAQVSGEMLSDEIVSTWFGLCAQIREVPVLARLENINQRRLVSNLVHSLRGIGLSRVESQTIAKELKVVIYGVWLNLAYGVSFGPDDGRETLFGYLNMRVPQCDS